VDIDEEANHLVGSYLRGDNTEADVRRALGDLLAKSQVHIYAVSRLCRYRSRGPIHIDHQDIAQRVLLRVWNRLQRTGECPPFDIELFAQNHYSFMAWSRVNAENAARSLIGDDVKSQGLRIRANSEYERRELTRLEEVSTVNDSVLAEIAERSPNKSVMLNCFLIRRNYNFPEPRGIRDREARIMATALIDRLRNDYRKVHSALQEPVVQRALTHWRPSDYYRAQGLPDRVLAAIVIESLFDRASINRQKRLYNARVQELAERSRQ
jgi:DNA-directed RNA polymerase specialized sigma24 family protein